MRNSLSRREKRALDNLLVGLFGYFASPEGVEFSERLEQINSSSPKTASVIPPALPPLESKAIAFIEKRLAQGHSPSVREIAQAVGFRSSRSGLRIVQKLTERGATTRDTKGKLEIRVP